MNRTKFQASFDIRMRKLLCKHICAVIQQPGIGWEALGSKFDTYPLYTLDKVIVQLPPSPNIDSSSPTMQ